MIVKQKKLNWSFNRYDSSTALPTYSARSASYQILKLELSNGDYHEVKKHFEYKVVETKTEFLVKGSMVERLFNSKRFSFSSNKKARNWCQKLEDTYNLNNDGELHFFTLIDN